MSIATGIVARAQRRLPASLGQRIRLLFALFALLVAALAAMDLVGASVPLWPNGLGAVAALTVIAAWSWAQYRRGGLTPLWTAVPIVALFAVGWFLGSHRPLFGLMFVLIFGRALYGSPRGVWLSAAGYFVAYEGLEAAFGGVPALLDVSTVTAALGIVVSTAVMWLLGDVVRTHERSMLNEEVFARLVSRVQGMECRDEIYAAAVDTTLELVGPLADVNVSVWRGDDRALRICHRDGAVRHDLPDEIPLRALPDHIRHMLLAGESFALDRAAAALVQQAVGMEPTATSILVAPMAHGARLSGAIAIGATRPLPPDLVGVVGRVARGVALVLDKVDSRTLLRQIVDNSSDAIILLDAGLKADFASPAIEPLLGYAPDQLVGRAIDDLLGYDATALQSALERAASASGQRDPEVLSLRHRSGAVRLIEVAASPLSDMRRPGWVVNLRDVTRRVEMEDALRESEERFRSLAENVTEGLYRMTLHPEPRFEYVNPAIEKITGYAARAFLEDPALPFRDVHPDDRAVISRSRTDPASMAWPADFRWHHRDKGWRWLSFRETVVFDDDGTPLSSMGIISDITALKQQEEALRGALEKERRVAEELRRVDVMKTTFIQAVSHELRTPLTAIAASAQILERNGRELDDQMRARLLARLSANAAKLEQLLIDLLDVERLSSERIEPIRSPVDVAEMCRRIVEQVDDGTHPVTCGTRAVVADVDAPKVERIVENLVRNAFKHTAIGTPILVHVVPDEAGEGALVVVEDRGAGIPPDLREEVFKPFVQGPDSAASPNPGTGIGLAVVARFAELHGGRAWIEEPEGGGTRFCVWLPAAESRPTRNGHRGLAALSHATSGDLESPVDHVPAHVA